MKRVLVSGATGLIGQAIVKFLLRENEYVIALARSIERAESIFGKSNKNLEYIISDVCDIEPKNINVDYIIHGASQTSSRAFIEEPIETITTALTGTKNMLEFARVNNVKGFVYLSSMEVYGSPLNDLKIDEKHGTNLDTMKVRSCYPESKRMCESLCASYSSEFGVPAKVVRLTQTFGPGVKYDDGRVFAEFARCAIERRNIVLKTKGETRRSYLYTEDAVNAILTVLYNGIPGQAYNAANEETYCSIKEMADLVASQIAKSSIEVIVNTHSDTKTDKFLPELKMNLSVDWLKNLGWTPHFSLANAFERTMKSLTDNTGGNL